MWGENVKYIQRWVKRFFFFLASHSLLCVPTVVSLKKAQEVFDNLPTRTVMSWNTLIARYAKHDLGEKALDCFEQMKLEGVIPDAITFTCSLKACGSIQDLSKGIEIYGEIMRNGLLKSDPVLGSALVDMYAKVGLLQKSLEIFDQLPSRTVGSWNAIIAAYTREERSKEALSFFIQMKLEGVLPNTITCICILSACRNIGSIEMGRKIHSIIKTSWPIEENAAISSALIGIYAQFGLLDQVEDLFNEAPSRNVDLWNALISFYAKHELSKEVLECLKQMQLEGVFPDAITYACGLKTCGNIGALGKGRELHAEMVAQHFYGRDLMVGNALIHMYGKCGFLVEAHKAFKNMLEKNIISWNTLMAGYVKHYCYDEALCFFEKMERKGVSPDAVTFACILKACNGVGEIGKGIEIHCEVEKKGFLERDLVLGNTLIDMYAKHGFLTEAQGVFDKLPKQDTISWITLMVGFLKFNQHKKALNCFEQMQLHGTYPDAITFAYGLKACGNIRAIEKGRQTHAEVIMRGLPETDLIVGIALVDMYSKWGCLETAKTLSKKLQNQDVVSWNATIATYAKNEQGEEALNYFKQMQNEGFSPNAITFACSLKACASLGDTVKGREIHADVERRGLLERSLVVGNALVDMYAKCGHLVKAQEAFDKLPRRDVVSWNTLIASHVKYGFNLEALENFKEMQKEGFSPDAVTFVCSLKACGNIGAIVKGIELHNDIKEAGLLKNVCIGIALIEMYAKYGLLEKAQAVFDQLPYKNVIAWNTLMSGLWNNQEAMLGCFDEMEQEGICPDAVTYVSVLKACGDIGLIEKGRKIHREIEKKGWLEKETAIGNTLIDMYAKLGWINQASEVFEKHRKRDLVSWNAFISGYAQLGEAIHAIVLFQRLMSEGNKPDSITLVNILNACSHAGLMDEAHVFFITMNNDYDIIPTLEHYTCMIDLLGRSGQLEMALAMMFRLPILPNALIWCTTLAACRKWGNAKLASYAFEQVMQLDERNVAAYFIMYNTSG